MTKRSNNFSDPAAGPPPRDELDSLLRQWHDVNAERAAAGRDELVGRLRDQGQADRGLVAGRLGTAASFVRIAIMNRYSPIAASLLFAVVVIALLVPRPHGAAYAQEIMVPEGGRLDALDEQGNILGPCPRERSTGFCGSRGLQNSTMALV